MGREQGFADGCAEFLYMIVDLMAPDLKKDFSRERIPIRLQSC